MGKYSKYVLDVVAMFAQHNEWFESMLKMMWNVSFKRSSVVYNARGAGYVEVCDLLETTQEEDNELLKWLDRIGITENMAEDTKAIIIAKAVNNWIKYTGDKVNYGKNEYWAGPYTVYEKAKDDCDGYSFLILKLMELAGIPSYRRKISAGDTQYGGHAYIIYLSRMDNNWYVIEGSLFPLNSIAKFGRTPHNKRDIYGKIWFTFNEVYSWSQEDTVV